jgi:CRP-like cAMP-binding protein
MTDITPLVRTLQRRDVLSPADITLIQAMPLRVVSFSADQEIVSEGSRPAESCAVLYGFAARSQYLREGQRQITAVHVPGDFVDLHSYLLKKMDHSVVSLGSCTVGYVPHADVRAVTQASQHLARMFWLLTVIDGAIQRAWITCLGRRSVDQHLAHLVCELYVRLAAVGVASGLTFDFPITQQELGDMLGLSTVHVNRRLQKLRGLGLLQWQNSKVTIVNFERLADLAEFDETYLSLHMEPR